MINPIKALAARRAKKEQLLTSPINADELLRQIEIKDARFRKAAIIFYALTIVGIGLIVISTYGLQRQNHDLLTELNKSASDQRAEVADLKSHIDCLFVIATTPHSTTNPPKVTNVKECNITPGDEPLPSSQSVPLSVSSPRPLQFLFVPGSSSSTSVAPSSPKAQGAPTAGSTPPPTTNPSPKPVTVLGVPVCVPLTNVCVDQ